LSKENHINRILLLKTITDNFLDKNETFIDISNRSALYYYLDRKIPIEATPYNLPHLAMQERSVERLSSNPPPMAILSSSNLNNDSGSVSLRAYPLYKWILENYIPVKIGNVIIGIHKSKISRFYARISRNTEIIQLTPTNRNVPISNITDDNWKHGISRSSPTFIVGKEDVNNALLKPLTTIHFSNGEKRLLKTAFYSGKFVNIQVHGDLLNSSAHPPHEVYFEGELDISIPPLSEQVYLWNQAFFLPELKKLPIAWGKSLPSLNSRLEKIFKLHSVPVSIMNMQKRDDGEYTISNTPATITYDIKSPPFSGKDAGILGFKMTCTDATLTRVGVSWNNIPSSTLWFSSGNGQVLVPLDSSPGWLLAGKISILKFHFVTTGNCNSFKLNDVVLYTRHSRRTSE
jgi:hypothetical protein